MIIGYHQHYDYYRYCYYYKIHVPLEFSIFCESGSRCRAMQSFYGNFVVKEASGLGFRALELRGFEVKGAWCLRFRVYRVPGLKELGVEGLVGRFQGLKDHVYMRSFPTRPLKAP